MTHFEKAKKYYDEGVWNKQMLHNLTDHGYITPEEYAEITGEPYATE